MLIGVLGNYIERALIRRLPIRPCEGPHQIHTTNQRQPHNGRDRGSDFGFVIQSDGAVDFSWTIPSVPRLYLGNEPVSTRD